MGWLHNLKRTLQTRDRYQWLGFKHQLSALYHDRRRADDSIRGAHASFDRDDVSEDNYLEGADLDQDSAGDQAVRDAAIRRERLLRQRGRS